MYKFTKKTLSALATFAIATLLTVGLTPVAANATVANANSNIVRAQYKIPFTWNTNITPTAASARTLAYVSEVVNANVASLVGKSISFDDLSTFSSPLTRSDIARFGTLQFLNSSNIIIDQANIEDSTGTVALVPNSYVVPANAVKMKLSFSGIYHREVAADKQIPQAPINLNYVLKVDGVAQTVTVDTANSAPSSGFYYQPSSNYIRFEGFDGAYTIPSNAQTAIGTVVTCVNPSLVTSTDTLTSTLYRDGVEVTTSGNMTVSYNYTNLIASDFGYSARTMALSTQSSMYQAGLIRVEANGSEVFPSANTTQGAHTGWDLSIKNQANVEVTTECVVPTFTNSTPTATIQWGTLTITAPAGAVSSSDKWILNIYRASDQTTPIFTQYGYSGSGSMNDLRIQLSDSTLPKGVALVAKYIRAPEPSGQLGSSLRLRSAPSPASNEFTLPKDSVDITSTFSNGSGSGQATNRTAVGSEMPYTQAYNTNDYSMLISDSNEGFYKMKFTTNPASAIELYHLTKTGLDANFGGTGNAAAVINAGTDGISPAVGWYGNRSKWAATYSTDSSGSPNSFSQMNHSLVLKTGTAGSATTETITVPASTMSTFCDENLTGSKYAGGISTSVLSSPMAKPLISLTCKLVSGQNTTQMNFLVQVNAGANPSITKLYQANHNGDPFASVSGGNGQVDGSRGMYYTIFPNASASSDLAAAFYVFSGSVSSNYNTTVNGMYLVRLKMDGTYTETSDPFGVAPSTYSSSQGMSVMNNVPNLPAMTIGNKVVAFSQSKFYQSTTGAFDAGTNYTLDTVSSFGQSSGADFSLATFVESTNKIHYVRWGGGMVNGAFTQNIAPGVLSLTTNSGTTGEVVTQVMPMSMALSQYFFDSTGAMNGFVETAKGKYSLIYWNPMIANFSNGGTSTGGGGGGGGGGGTPTATISSQSSAHILAGVGGKVTFTGTGLTAATSATVGGVAAAISGKKATAFTLTMPKNLAAGEQSIVVTFGSTGTLTRTVTYIAGTVKQPQTVTPPVGLPAENTPWTGTAIPFVIPGTSSAGLSVSITLSPAATCAMVSSIPTIIGAGKCTITITQAGDLGVNKVTQVVTVTVNKGALETEVDDPFTITDNPADTGSNGGEDNDRQLTPSSSFSGATRTYSSSNTDICTVDEAGLVAGVSAGTCVITIVSSGGNNWATDTRTVSVTVAPSSNTSIPDVLSELTDGSTPARNIPSAPSVFVPTNDSSLLVKWDKAKGLLTLQSKGIYTGYILAETTFTAANSTTYTCTNVFGTTKAMPGKTATQKKAAFKGKVFSAASAACKDASGLVVPANLATDFLKIKKSTKAKGTATAIGTKAYETAAQTQLKGFTGTVTIKITRYRAWPTTMKNLTGAGKRIPATVRTTVINLQ